MEKLVRDNIPDLMCKAGSTPSVRQATPQERLGLLLRKLDEEVEELKQAPSIEECADVFEVIVSIAQELGVGREQLFAAADNKMAVCGGFKKGYVLDIKE